MTMDTTETAKPLGLGSTEGLGPTPLPTPAGFRTRYRSEPGMIGHYPWTYADAGRRKGNRPECEYEDLFTAEQMLAAVVEERQRSADACARLAWMMECGGGDPEPGGRLRQAQRMILDGTPTPDYMTADMRRMP